MNMEWTNKKVIEFIKILETEPCLWDPRQHGYKNRATQNDAWRRLKKLSPYPTTIEEMKKKKESLMGYYRIHLNKYNKSIKCGTEVYTTNWFAYEAMDRFLRAVYENNRTLNIAMNEDSEVQEISIRENDGTAKSLNKSPEIKEATQNTEVINRTLQRKNSSSQDFSPRLSGSNNQSREELHSGIRAVPMAFEDNMRDSEDNIEYETFGRLIASKIQKIRNPNTRDILMNDIHNLVFRTCMTDRLEHQSAVSSYLSQTSQSISRTPDYQMYNPSSPSLSTYSTFQSPSGSTTSQSPHHHVYTTSPSSPIKQSPPGQSCIESSQEILIVTPTHPSLIIKTDDG